MKQEYLPYVMPIFRRSGDERSFAGTVFCIDGYLVTAGHVLDDSEVHYVRYGADYHRLERDKWYPQVLPAADRLGYDIAFYPVPGLKSPLALSASDAQVNEHLDIACWQYQPHGLVRVNTRGLAIKEMDEDGYQRIATVDHITHGCSGCPVLSDNEVVGMITMGRHSVDTQQLSPLLSRMESNTCWAFKSSHIRRFLPPAGGTGR